MLISVLFDLLQYFDFLEDVEEEELQYYGGAVSLADYCPFLQVEKYLNSITRYIMYLVNLQTHFIA